MIIHKYPLEQNEETVLNLPLNSELLEVGVKDGWLNMWFVVDTEQEVHIKRKFRVIGTGFPLPDGIKKHVGTVVMEPFVWHVFEVEYE